MVLATGFFSFHITVLWNYHKYPQFQIWPLGLMTPKSFSLTQNPFPSFRFISIPYLLYIFTWRPHRHSKLHMAKTEFINTCPNGYLYLCPSASTMMETQRLLHLCYSSHIDLWLFCNFIICLLMNWTSHSSSTSSFISCHCSCSFLCLDSHHISSLLPPHPFTFIAPELFKCSTDLPLQEACPGKISFPPLVRYH